MKGVFSTLINSFRVPELRKKIFYTMLILSIYQLGSLIPVPGLNRTLFSEILSRMGQIGQMMNIISGGSLYAASIFAMGITPYINSSIIIQLLTVAIPALERMQKEGEPGRKKIQRIVRFTTIGLALVQAVAFWFATKEAMTTLLNPVLCAILIIVSFTAGTAFIMWLGERINEKGIGNGISLIIFTGIVTRIPDMATQLFNYASDVSGYVDNAILGVILGTLLFIVVTLITAGIIIFVIFVQNAERRISVQYSKKVVGRKTYGGQNTYLPLKVNQSGVMPVIFAMSILSLPQTLVSMFWASYDNAFVNFFRNFGENPVYYVVEVLLIVGFTFFYSMIQFNPIEISNNLQKNGGFIPGVRPGRPTSDFIARTAGRINWADGIFLSLVVLAPTLLGTLARIENVWFAGTSVLILTGVANDLVKQIEAQMVTHHYKGFLD